MITVKGHSADLRSEMKASKLRHWDDTSVKDIVTEISVEYGLDPKISDAVSGHVYAWIGKQDETDLNFWERVAKRHGALFTIKNGALLWLERGAGKTADGTSVPATVIIPTSVVEGSCQVSENDVDRFGKVKAFYQDRGEAKRQEVIVDGWLTSQIFWRAPGHRCPRIHPWNGEALLCQVDWPADFV